MQNTATVHLTEVLQHTSEVLAQLARYLNEARVQVSTDPTRSRPPDENDQPYRRATGQTPCW